MKKEDIIFYEYQRLKRQYLSIILIPVNLIFLYLTITQLWFGEQWGNYPKSDLPLVIDMPHNMNVPLILITIFFNLFTVNTLWINMTTIVDKIGIHIHVRLCPFFVKSKSYSWNNISKARIRKSLPICEFGVCGIRLGIKSVSYNMSGTNALQLVLRNNKRVVIGTQKKEELWEILQKFENQKKSKE